MSTRGVDDHAVPVGGALRAYALAIAGTFLVFAPWSGLWEQSMLYAAMPSWLSGALRSGFGRGAVSGLGVVDLVLASADLGAVAAVLRRKAPRSLD